MVAAVHADAIRRAGASVVGVAASTPERSKAAVVEENGAWRIGALAYDPTWAASHSRGWARVQDGEPAKLVAPVTSDLPPPDRPLLGPAAPPFPAIADVPFDYQNPVSGRPAARNSF